MSLQSPFHIKYAEQDGRVIVAGNVALIWNFRPIEEEVKMVRERAGFTDYSINNLSAVTGKDALPFLQKMLVNDLNKIHPGKAIYSSMLDETGAIIDDITALWVEEEFFIYNGDLAAKANANRWLKNHTQGFDVNIVEYGFGFLAFQGPKSRELLQKVADIQDLPYFGLKRVRIGHIPVHVARIGFTGEIGYELYVHPLYANDLWDALVEIGKDDDAGPYGYANTMALAIEKGYLWGPDFYQDASPLEVGLGWTVAFDKGDFIGKEALLNRKREGLKARLVAFEGADPKVVARENDKLFKDDKEVGQITNAGRGRSIMKPSIGRAWVEMEYAQEGETLELEHKGQKTQISVKLDRDWYDPQNKIIKS